MIVQMMLLFSSLFLREFFLSSQIIINVFISQIEVVLIIGFSNFIKVFPDNIFLTELQIGNSTLNFLPKSHTLSQDSIPSTTSPEIFFSFC